MFIFNILSFSNGNVSWRTFLASGSCSSHCRTWQSLVSLTSRQSGLLLVTRLEMPIPHLVEHSVQSVVCGKQLGSSNTSDTGKATRSVQEQIKVCYNQIFRNYDVFVIINLLMNLRISTNLGHTLIDVKADIYGVHMMNNNDFGYHMTFTLRQCQIKNLTCTKQIYKSNAKVLVPEYIHIPLRVNLRNWILKSIQKYT